MNPTGRPPSFTLREERYVPAAEVVRALAERRRLVILDARPASDWSLAHIPGALPFPFYDIEQMASRLPRDGTWILAYCACPHAASGHVVDELRRRHFEHTAIIDEGIQYWIAQGFPTERPAAAAVPGTPAPATAPAPH
jgi:rhodanese-related sulfurtransferase